MAEENKEIKVEDLTEEQTTEYNNLENDEQKQEFLVKINLPQEKPGDPAPKLIEEKPGDPAPTDEPYREFKTKEEYTAKISGKTKKYREQIKTIKATNEKLVAEVAGLKEQLEIQKGKTKIVFVKPEVKKDNKNKAKETRGQA